MKKIIIALMILVIPITIKISVNAKLNSNNNVPVNIALDNWTTPILTYQGSYVTQSTITNINDPSSIITFSFTMQDVREVNIYATDANNVNRTYNLQSAQKYDNVIRNFAGTLYPAYIITSDISPVSITFEVYTRFDFVSSGGNTTTFKNNIQSSMYLSVSSLWGISDFTQVLINNAYDNGYLAGENDGYIAGTADGYADGYRDGVIEANEGFSYYALLLSVPITIIAGLMTIEILPNFYTGYIAGFSIIFGLMAFYFSLKGGKKQ